MPSRTPLHASPLAAGAKMVDFSGWEMPIHYGSQIEEHHAVRRDAGMFDVSHMCALDLAGPGARDYLRRLLANDVARLTVPGRTPAASCAICWPTTWRNWAHRARRCIPACWTKPAA